jgi:ribose transport system substrate-binding protein
MSRVRYASALQIVALTLIVLAGGCSEKRTRIVFLTNGSDPFWDACRSGLEEGAKKYELEQAGYTVSMEVNNGKPQGQIDKLRQFASQGDVAAVAISVIQADNAAIIEEMKNLQAKGIKIITVDADVNREKFREARPYYIGTDNIVGGRALGTAGKAILESRGRRRRLRPVRRLHRQRQRS